ncbi:hypothetical protein G3I44_08335 [Halogeometricum borinquense]|uniref:Uncharacterized protein n=1 Tax=Halogeometricum borinquense TaxID=60847 RepID=A0A6C0UMY4_9EURY|nr:hypothetical protein [Halogeometricum borinquense]QIB74288.1 hypothetical protein G3I44_08335 [Halogeometricum borinquense]
MYDWERLDAVTVEVDAPIEVPGVRGAPALNHSTVDLLTPFVVAIPTDGELVGLLAGLRGIRSTVSWLRTNVPEMPADAPREPLRSSPETLALTVTSVPFFVVSPPGS